MFYVNETVQIIAEVTDPDTQDKVQGDSATVKIYNSLGDVVLNETDMTYDSTYSRYEYNWTPTAEGTYSVYVTVTYSGTVNKEKIEVEILPET